MHFAADAFCASKLRNFKLKLNHHLTRTVVGISRGKHVSSPVLEQLLRGYTGRILNSMVPLESLRKLKSKVGK